MTYTHWNIGRAYDDDDAYTTIYIYISIDYTISLIQHNNIINISIYYVDIDIM